MKTLEEAKVAAKSAGIPDEDLTPEVLKRFGWEVEDILAGLNMNPAQTDQEVQELIVLLEEERKANNLPANIAKVVGSLFTKFFI